MKMRRAQCSLVECSHAEGHAQTERAVAFCFLLLVALAGPAANADGGFFPPELMPVVETAQLAVLSYDPDTAAELLILRVQYLGDTKDFAWIVPVPSLPELAAGEDDLFWQFADLTMPVHRERSGCSSGDFEPGLDYGSRSDVFVHDVQAVGIYSTMTLSADDATALSDSLAQWGYLHDENRAAVEEALAFYVAKGWYFVAMKIDAAGPGGDYTGGHWYGPLEPISLRFATPEAVYPLRISKVSAAEDTPLWLYVCAPHRMASSGARTVYANRFDSDEVQDVGGRYPHVAELLEPGSFVTKLEYELSPAEMDDDIILRRAANDDEFRLVDYESSLPASELLLVAAAGYFAMRGRRRKRVI